MKSIAVAAFVILKEGVKLGTYIAAVALTTTVVLAVTYDLWKLNGKLYGKLFGWISNKKAEWRTNHPKTAPAAA